MTKSQKHVLTSRWQIIEEHYEVNLKHNIASPFLEQLSTSHRKECLTESNMGDAVTSSILLRVISKLETYCTHNFVLFNVQQYITIYRLTGHS